MPPTRLVSDLDRREEWRRHVFGDISELTLSDVELERSYSGLVKNAMNSQRKELSYRRIYHK